MRESVAGTEDELREEVAHQNGEVADTTTRRLRSMPRDAAYAPRSTDADAGTGYMTQIQDHEEREQQTRKRPVAAPLSGAELPLQRDVLNHANFGLLPEEKGRFRSFGVAAVVNIALGILILALTINKVHEVAVRRQETLTYLAPPPKPYVPPVPKVVLPPIPPLPKEETKIIPPVPKPVIEPPKVETPKVAEKAPAMPAPAPKPVVTPPRPALAFQTQQAAAQTQRVAATQTAGFGNPTGVQANPNANRPTQLAVAGGFGAAANSNTGSNARQGAVTTTGFGSGAPSGSPSGTRGAVASTGFGSGSQPAGQPGGRGTVASTGFGAGSQPGGSPSGHGAVTSTGFGQAAAAAGTPARVQQVATTPLVVLSKPLPQYTAEARDQHIQGDVILEVRFTADGQVEVLRVVNGLGHGLDEQARLAAARIRFKPATRDGKPVDQISVIHVAFQLA